MKQVTEEELKQLLINLIGNWKANPNNYPIVDKWNKLHGLSRDEMFELIGDVVAFEINEDMNKSISKFVDWETFNAGDCPKIKFFNSWCSDPTFNRLDRNAICRVVMDGKEETKETV